ncbi:MAG: hypothetical protein RBS68_03145 [Anaerolineales bacterium]|nr:hypothetical protein [Anaerolineales bacterium]
MPQKIALLTLLLATLACSLPFSGPAAPPADATLALATLAGDTLTAVTGATEPAPPPATETLTPPPAATNLNIVYAQRGNLLLWRAGGPPQTLTTTGQDESPRFSADGQVIAFLRNGELYAVRADGTGERPLVQRSYLNGFRSGDIREVYIQHFDFIPGAHEVFFTLSAQTENFGMPLADLQRVNADSGAASVILAPGRGGGLWTFSPDGQYFSLAQGDGIRVLARDGSQDRVVFTFKFVSTYSEWAYFPQVIWRNDSAGFYTVIPASAALDDPTEPTRYYYIPLAGEAARLAEFVAAPVWQSFPFISPDGIQVAYVRASGGTSSLHVIDASTADRTYTSGPALTLLNWNPDSARVAYYAEDPAAPSLLGFGGSPTAINDTARFSGLEWISESRCLFLNDQELRLRNLPDPSVLVADGVGDFDFVLLP